MIDFKGPCYGYDHKYFAAISTNNSSYFVDVDFDQGGFDEQCQLNFSINSGTITVSSKTLSGATITCSVTGDPNKLDGLVLHIKNK